LTLTFNKNYFALFILVFTIECLIALYVHDNFIRPYLGDVLVVILIYCFVKSFVNLPVLTAAVAVLVFAFIIEFLQFLNTVEKLHLEKNKIASTVIGTSFSWMDILMYVVGIAIVIAVEKYLFKKEVRLSN